MTKKNEIKYTRQAAKVLRAYAAFAEDVGDAITASLFPGKSDPDAIADVMTAHSELKNRLASLGYKPPKRVRKKGSGHAKNTWKCRKCNGTGMLYDGDPGPGGYIDPTQCPRCKGTGRSRYSD